LQELIDRLTNGKAWWRKSRPIGTWKSWTIGNLIKIGSCCLAPCVFVILSLTTYTVYHYVSLFCNKNAFEQ
jgi:hypothetical protein